MTMGTNVITREAIRGTGGLVDGVRSVYALWNPKEEQAKAICKTLGETFDLAAS